MKKIFGRYKEELFDKYKEKYDFKEQIKKSDFYVQQMIDNIEAEIKYYLESGLARKEMSSEEKEEIDFLTSLFTKENCKNKIFVEKYYNVFLKRLLKIQNNILIRIKKKEIKQRFTTN